MKKKVLIAGIIVLVLLLGVAYAWFSYLGIGRNKELVAGDLYFRLDSQSSAINLTGIFPESAEEARVRDDNFVTFSLVGKNETGKPIYYEITLIHGDEETGLERFHDKDLRFDLIEIKNNQEIYLLDAVGFEELNDVKIWVDAVDKETNSQITRTYKLRMWLSDNVLISDSALNADYTATSINDSVPFKDHYASIKVGVKGEIVKKSFPLTFDLEPTLNDFSLALSNDYRPSELGEAANDNIELKISSDDTNIRFNYSYTNIIPAANEEDDDTEQEISNTNQTNVDLTFNYTKNETKDIELQVKHASARGSNILFEVIKNGVTVEKFIKTVYKSKNDINIMDTFPTTINSVNLKDTLTSIQFVNVSRSTLESDYSLENANVYDLTLVEDEEKKGDVRGKLNGTVLTVASEGKTYLSTGEVLFFEYTNLETIDFTNIDTSLVKSMYYMFGKSNKITSLNLSNFNTSNVTNMQGMFSAGGENRELLTSINLSNFNTSKVTTMQAMFKDCNGLTSLDLSNFNTSKVTTMQSMFSGCSGLTSLDLSSFDTSKVKSMRVMFYGCSGLTSLDLSNFNTSKVTTMYRMFYGCSGLTSLDVTHFNTSNVTSMKEMFRNCSGLTSLDLSNFNTENVENMFAMFHSCSSLTSLDVTHFDTRNVIDMGAMFSFCSALTSLDLSSFNTSNVTTMYQLFYSCQELSVIYVSNNWTTVNLSSDGSKTLFYNSRKLTGGNGTKYSASYRSATYARIDDPDNDRPGYFTYKPAPNANNS